MEHARLTFVSATDYLAMERAARVRHEFVGGQVFAKIGARDTHNTIALNIACSLKKALGVGPGRVFMSDVKLRVERADAYYYPDVFVTCEPRDTDPYVKRFPVLVIEVLSPHTEGVDRRDKLRNYRLLDTMIEYVLVAGDERRVEVYRLEPGAEWHQYVYGASETIDLVSLRARLPLDSIYEGVPS